MDNNHYIHEGTRWGHFVNKYYIGDNNKILPNSMYSMITLRKWMMISFC